MARCFPFPPPGYLWKGIGGESLLKLLELRREKAKSKNERKERRRKKKRRKHGHDEDEKLMQKRCDHDRKHKDDRSRNCLGKNDNQIGREHENPRLENSTLTEELGQPIIPADVYDCSDIRDEVKREKSHSSDHVGSLLQSSFRVHKDPEAVSVKPSCSTFTRMDIFDDQDKCESAYTFGKDKSSTSPSQGILTFSESGVLETESEYRRLIVNWVPPPLEIDQADFDDEWLYKRNLSRSERTHNKRVSNGFYQGSGYPNAHYLPDADIYALPYTIPF